MSELAVDSDGNAVVAGLSRGTVWNSTDYALATVKYAPDGTELWARRFERLGTTGSSWGQWGGMAVDAEGNVYLAGNMHSTGTGTQSDMVVIAYDPAGKLLWTATYDGPGAGLDAILDLALSPAGQILATGISDDGSASACATLAYAMDGKLLWSVHEPELHDAGAHISVDAAGRVFVLTTKWMGPANGIDMVVLAYDDSGNKQWETIVAGPDDNDEVPGALHAGTSGDLYVVFQTRLPNYGIPPKSDILTLRLGPAGDVLWMQGYGSSNYDEVARDIGVDDAGNVYFAGETYYWDFGGYVWHRYLTLKYSPAGALAWGIAFGEPVGPMQTPLAAAHGLDLSDDASCLFVTGSSIGVCTTLRYDQPAPPVVYCTSKSSSIAGCTPALGGSSSLASLVAGPGTCSVVCAPVPGGTQSAIPIASTGGALVPPIANTFGWLCIATGPAWFRLPVSLPGGTIGHCNGLYIVDVGGWLAAQAGNPALVPGSSLDIQVWYRDPPNPGGANLTNALAMEIVP